MMLNCQPHIFQILMVKSVWGFGKWLVKLWICWWRVSSQMLAIPRSTAQSFLVTGQRGEVKEEKKKKTEKNEKQRS